ncbi:MAG TPA: hypothetical protein VK477_02410, partial [Acidobacteriota bacterium]|nr:hypothetical protein [Acidobacteriota bacterium]
GLVARGVTGGFARGFDSGLGIGHDGLKFGNAEGPKIAPVSQVLSPAPAKWPVARCFVAAPGESP